jgi:two-component system OmpR family response regulator
MPRVLIVDDEPRIVSFVSRALTANGFTSDSAGDGARALDMARARNYELVILDLMMPGVDGMSLLRTLMEERPEQRVLVLSALSDVDTKVAALELGASDYVPKPFALAELMARVRARLRQPASKPAAKMLAAAGLVLEPMRRTVQQDGRRMALSDREYLVLEHLMRHAGEVCARQELLSDVWGYSFDPGSNIVDVYIGRLRVKLGSDAIETVRNVGYRLVVS